MSKCKKYVTGGSINPFWIAEQNKRNNNNNDCDVSISINVNIGNDHDDYLEGIFQFLKRHNTPDDLELAIKVAKSSLNNKK